MTNFRTAKYQADTSAIDDPNQVGDTVGLNENGNLTDTAGGIFAISEVTPYVTLTATGTAFTGACEYAGWYCSVAAGNITVYDALSATGTPIVPATALAVGPVPVFGPGNDGRMAFTTGCHVVLSGAATVRMLVG